jgi:hypothetical protein
MNRKMLEYFTAVDTDVKGLDKQFDSFIQRGYEPSGSPYIVSGWGSTRRIWRAAEIANVNSGSVKRFRQLEAGL